MIYFFSKGNLCGNIVLPKENCIEELKALRDKIVSSKSMKKSFSFVDYALSDRDKQLNNLINLSMFLTDGQMLSALYSSFSKLQRDSFYYILNKVSPDYDFFVNQIYDRILFEQINSYKIDDLRTAHRTNELFGIDDNYSDLLDLVNNADVNSSVLMLTKKIKGIEEFDN